jgi:hypothetical protein
MTDSYLPYVLPQMDSAGNAVDLQERAINLENNVIVGGIRITQRRGDLTSCPRAGNLISKAFSGSCVQDSANGLSYPQDVMNISTMDGLEKHFTPYTVPGDMNGPGFHFFLNAYDEVSYMIESLKNSVSLGWIDRQTTHLSVQTLFLNPDVGYLAQVSYDAKVTRGGRMAYKTTLQSISLDKYMESGGLYLLNIFMIFYSVYLLLGVLKRLIRIFCIRKGLSNENRWASLFSWGMLLDVGSFVALVTAMGEWGSFYLVLQTAKAQMANMALLIPNIPVLCEEGVANDGNSTEVLENNSTGTNTTDCTNPDDPPIYYSTLGSFPPEWAVVQQTFFNAFSKHTSFKTATVWALIFLTIRLFKYVSFQSRLSVVTDTINASYEDLVHITIAFGVIYIAYGVWAHFAFGTQVAWYGNESDGYYIFGMLRILMWDYDLEGIEQADPSTGRLFWATFMLIMSNVFLWMVFAVLFENYTMTRLSAARWPAAKDELIAFIQAMPHMFHIPRISWIWDNPVCRKLPMCRGGKASLVGKKTQTITWSEVIKLLTKGALAKAEYITADQLRLHLGVSPEKATLFIVDVASTDLNFVYWGHDVRGSEPLPDKMRDSLRALYPGIFANEDVMRSGTVSLLMPDLFGLSTSSGHDNDDDDEYPDEDDDHPSVYKRLRRFISSYLPPICGGKASSNFGNVISSRNSKYGGKSGGGLMGRKSSVKSVTNPLNKTANGNYEEEGDEAETGDKMAGGQEKSVGLNVRKVVATKTFAASPVAGNIVTVGAEERVQESSSAKSPSVPDSAVVIAEQSEDEERHKPSTDDATNTLVSSEEQTVVDENYWTPERIEEYHRQQAEYEAATAAYNAALAEAEAAKGTKKGKNKKKVKEEEEEDDEGEDDDVEA